MKHYLLTWYGITDLRAALGFERSDGPILGALKSGNFTDLIVLAYTDPCKKMDILAARQIGLDEILEGENASSKDLSHEAQSKVIDAFANTPEAHKRFKKWLRQQIQSCGREIRVQFCVKELQMLHDAKGIYDAAIQALDIVAAEPGEKRLTFYLSPGTPVMAFTWAFVALGNPELNIQVISSSEPRKPPVSVHLPYELLAPSNRRSKRKSLDEKCEFDSVFHLLGQQRLPSLLGILQFPCKSHYFVTSEKYSAEPMRHFLPSGSTFSELRVNPFDPMSSKVEILKVVAQMRPGARVGFNLTGGTKLMFAGAIAACRKIGAVPFYFETRDHNLVFLHDFTTLPMRGIENVELFFALNGFHISRSGKWQDEPLRQQRTHVTKHIWDERSAIASLYEQLSDLIPRNGYPFVPFCVQARSAFAKLERSGRAILKLCGVEFTLKSCPDFARYLCGGWLDEYIYLLLQPQLASRNIKDLRIGLEVSWVAPQPNSTPMAAQEFDICFTDGNRLTIMECKAGAVYVGDVYKLENCVMNYGGVDANGLLISAFSPSVSIRKRVQASAKLRYLSGSDVTNEVPKLLQKA